MSNSKVFNTNWTETAIDIVVFGVLAFAFVAAFVV